MKHPDLGRTAPVPPPIYPASVYAVPDLDELEAIITAGAPGYIYARDLHPNGRALADALAAAEGGSWGVVCASGMAAVTTALVSVCGPGGRVLASDQLYGRTAQLLRSELSRFGVRAEFLDVFDADRVRAALREPAAAVFVESVSNPLLRVPDLPALADAARAAGAKLLVDNTFATPVLLRPLEHGADLVVESLTKQINGHSDVTLGVVCGRDEALRKRAWDVAVVWGLASASGFDCWLAQRGMKTLALRVRASAANAAAVADWLAGRPGVSRVVYPGRPDHPDRDRAARLMLAGRGAVVSFELAGGRDAVNAFLRAAPGVPFAPSLGGAGTTCSHPASTSHRHDAPADRERLGITEGLVRLSVGVEDLGEITAELDRGLRAASG